MDAEHISKYEAAAMYAYENTTAQTEVTKERNYLILDLEQCSAGFCTCDQKETKLIHNWDTTQTDLWDLCIENLQKLAGGTEREQIVSELESQRSRADNIMRNYFLSDRTVNKTLYQFPESKITCAAFENAMQPVKEMLKNLMNRIKAQIDEATLADTGIVVLGQAQNLFWVMYEIRNFFSVDSMLPDERFLNEGLDVSYAEIVESGMNLEKDKHAAHHTYKLVVFDPDSQSESFLLLAEKGQGVQKVSYLETVLFRPKSSIVLRIDDEKKKYTLPDTWLTEPLELLDLGLEKQEGTDTLLVRRHTASDADEMTHSIRLEQ